MKADETIIIVDEHDTPIGTKLRANVTKKDIYRVTALWLTNSRGDILLAQRGLRKKNNPGEWGPAVAGTVEAGETYEANITKEVYEELGLKVELTPFKKVFINNQWRFFCQYYTASVDKPADEFKIETENIEQVAWFSAIKLKQELKTDPKKFIASADVWLQLFL